MIKTQNVILYAHNLRELQLKILLKGKLFKTQNLLISRVAIELGETIGQRVGYLVGMEARSSFKT